jgi:hypothetical protein
MTSPRLARLAVLLPLLALACATAGGLPDWVRNPYAEFSKDKYVVAVGSGHNLDAAKRDAMNGIAAYLGVEINATQGSEETETVTREDGERHSSGHLRAAESVNQIISQKLSSVTIERAHSQGPTTYVLALLDKATFLAGLTTESENAARQLSEGVKTAGAESQPSRSMLLGLQAIAQRLEALDARIIALGGKVTPDVQVTLRDSLGFLARFDIAVPPPAAPAAAAAAGPACDEGDPRLKKAVAEMSAIVGHGVGVKFNLDQLPKGRSYCDQLFESHIGLLPKNLAYLKERKPAIFAYGGPSLKRVDIDYDGTDQYADITFDRASGVLRLVIGGRSSYPIPSDTFGYIFEKQYEAWVIGHFQGVEPEAVAAAEYPLYYDYLTRLAWWGKGEPGARTGKKDDDLSDDPKAGVLMKMIRFASLATKAGTIATDKKGAKLGTVARDWLAEQYEFFGRAYLHQPGPVTRAAATSPWKKAERAWIDWMNGAFDGLPDENKKKLLPEMLGFTMPFNNDEGIVWNDFAYPGLKTYDMGLGVIDRWLKAGHPGPDPRRSLDDKQLALFTEVASPVKRDRQGSWSVETFERRKNWYFHAMRSEGLRKRLLSDVLARKDDVFTEAVFANLLRTSIHLGGNYAKDQRDEWADFLYYWRGVEADPKQWKVATRLLGEAGFSGETKQALYDESVKVWRRYPWSHGTLLYVLGVGARYEHKLIPWAEWGRVFGAPVSAKEAGDFLDLGPRAVAALPIVWPAFGKGWSRADVLVPRLDRFIEDPLTRANNFQDPYETLKEVVFKMRDEKATGDIGRLHAYLKKRVADHPSEERTFTTLLEMTK